MTLEGHQFELHGSIYRQIFFNIKYYSTTLSAGAGGTQVQREPPKQRANSVIHTDFQPWEGGCPDPQHHSRVNCTPK